MLSTHGHGRQERVVGEVGFWFRQLQANACAAEEETTSEVFDI